MGRFQDYDAVVRAHPEWFVNPPHAAFTILLRPSEMRQAELQQAQRLETQTLPAEWARVGLAYQDQYLCLLRDAVRFPDGSLHTYIRFVPRLEGASSVMVVPVYQARMLLIRHFRHATRTWHVEFPAGSCEQGCTVAEDAQRELSEEIGAAASRLVSLGRVHGNVGLSAEYFELFYADISSYGVPDAHEGIAEIIPVTAAEFERLVREHTITAAHTLAAYACVRANGLI
ncbi:MAG: hypothetical protein PVSMB4_12020 [Ktedonobacterales bacterium]